MSALRIHTPRPGAGVGGVLDHPRIRLHGFRPAARAMAVAREEPGRGFLSHLSALWAHPDLVIDRPDSLLGLLDGCEVSVVLLLGHESHGDPALPATWR